MLWPKYCGGAPVLWMSEEETVPPCLSGLSSSWSYPVISLCVGVGMSPRSCLVGILDGYWNEKEESRWSFCSGPLTGCWDFSFYGSSPAALVLPKEKSDWEYCVVSLCCSIVSWYFLFFSTTTMQQNSDMKHTEFTNIHNIVYYSQQLWSHH